MLPRADVRRLGRLPGVRRVYGNVTYRIAAGPDATTIRAAALRSTTLANGGAGIKIGIIDDGLDQTHPLLRSRRARDAAGFPKGQQAYTTAKVIVARSFPPPGATWRHAGKPFDPEESGHGTHVAGIAAGNANVLAEGQRVSGIAPRALLGNYKALTIPTDANVGLDGNAPEIVAAIEAAVADGMDVINLSIGEPEVEPSRDLVALALDAAAAAGVVPVVAAGNDFGDYRSGSLASPGSSADSITVGATSSGAAPVIAGFSSAGPTPVSLRLKPDVVAPGQSILSAAPERRLADVVGNEHGGAARRRGRCAAARAPSGVDAGSGEGGAHRDGPATRRRRPHASRRRARRRRCCRRAARAGEADRGLLRPRRHGQDARPPRRPGGCRGRCRDVDGLCRARRDTAGHAHSRSRRRSSVPGGLDLQLSTGTTEGVLSGTLVLSGAQRVRRIPFWARVSVPRLAVADARPLTRPGIYAGDTRGKPARVEAYRYPEVSPTAP